MVRNKPLSLQRFGGFFLLLMGNNIRNKLKTVFVIMGEILFVVFTERKDAIRLISARLATEAERRLYYDQDIYY